MSWWCRMRGTTSWWLLVCMVLQLLVGHHAAWASSSLMSKNVGTPPEIFQVLAFDSVTLELEELDQLIEDYQPQVPVEAQMQRIGYHAATCHLHYQWWSEGVHGSMEPCVTCNDPCAGPTRLPFPSGLGTAFHTTLYRHMGHSVFPGTSHLEARAANGVPFIPRGVTREARLPKPAIQL